MSKKNKPFKIIADAQELRGRLREVTGNELKVWMYLWLGTKGELTTFPGNQTIADDLDVNIDTVKDARRGLRDKGWTSKESRRRNENGTLSTTVEKVHQPWGEKAPLVGQNEGKKAPCGTQGENFHQHKYDVVPNPEVSPLAHEKSEVGEQQQPSSLSSQTPQVNSEPQLVAGYTAEQIAKHADACRMNAWVHANDSPKARLREGFVTHLMTIDPPKKRLRMKSDGVTPQPRYRQESGERTILKGDI